MTNIQAVLRGIFVLVGLRAENLPVPEEMAVLLQLILESWGNLSIGEMVLAFKMAVSGRLNVDATCYQNFSPEYFGKIMAAYVKWASQTWDENQMYNKPIPEDQKQLTMEGNFFETTELYFQDFLQNRLNLNLMPSECYDALVKAGFTTEDFYEEMLPDARKKLITNLRATLEGEKQDRARDIINERITHIEAGEITIPVKKLAKKFAARYIFREAKNRNMQALFEKTKD